MKAQKWLARVKGTVDPFNRLSEAWRGFNNLFFPVRATNEREKIKSFLLSKTSANDASALMGMYKREIAYLLSKPVVDMRGNGNDTSDNIAAYHSTTDPVRRVVELFMIIYQVRCNLEHGQKAPDTPRDAELCAYSSSIVARVVELYA